MARNEKWLDEDLERMQGGQGPKTRHHWTRLVGPSLRRRGANEADVDDVVNILWKGLACGRSRPRLRDRGRPLCERVLARPPEERPAYVCRMAVRIWSGKQDGHPQYRKLRRLVGQVRDEARAMATPEAPPTRLRRGGRFDREAVKQAVAWLLGQPFAGSGLPADLTRELLAVWAFELEPQPDDAEADYEAEDTTHDALHAAESVYAALDPRSRRILARFDAGLTYRELAAELGCGIATVSRCVAEVMRRLADATDHDHRATVLALAILQERCAAAERH